MNILHENAYSLGEFKTFYKSIGNFVIEIHNFEETEEAFHFTLLIKHVNGGNYVNRDKYMLKAKLEGYLKTVDNYIYSLKEENGLNK